MSIEVKEAAMAISIADIQAHPAEAMAALIETVRRQGEEITCLQDNLAIALGLIAKLRERIDPKPTKDQASKGEVLRAVLAANGGKMLAKDARQKLGMDKASFSRLTNAMSCEITLKKFHANRRQNVIILNG